MQVQLIRKLLVFEKRLQINHYVLINFEETNSEFSILTADNLHIDKELFIRIAGDDEQAFTELFHICTPRLLPFIIKLTRNEHVAEEMIQETFLRLWLNRAELTKVDNPAAWIYRVASNISITWLRKQGNRRKLLQKVETTEATDSTTAIVDSKELGLIIRTAVDLLPERRQEIYRLSRDQGLTHQQIAEKLNLSPNTVKNQIGIALKFIQEIINKKTGLSLSTIMMLFLR